MGSLVLFDYEGSLGMPQRAPYDIGGTTSRILKVLEHHGTHAMFFMVGRLVEEQPDLVARVHEAGQAVGVHGYRHERLSNLSQRDLGTLERDLQRVQDIVAKITGERPVAFRAPYLLWPGFADEGLARLLVKLGFRWTSCRFLRYPEEVAQGREWFANWCVPVLQRLGLFDLRRSLGRGAFVVSNIRLLASDPDLDGLLPAARWLLGPRGPIVRAEALYDVPVGSPPDTRLLGLPRPDEPSPEALLAFVAARLGDAPAHDSKVYTVSFHDWLIGSSNRLRALDEVLARLAGTSHVIDARYFDPGATVEPRPPEGHHCEPAQVWA